MLTKYLDFAIDLDKVYALRLDENDASSLPHWAEARSLPAYTRQGIIMKSTPMLKIFVHDPTAPVTLELRDPTFWDDVAKSPGWRIVDDVWAIDTSKVAVANIMEDKAALLVRFDLGDGRHPCLQVVKTFAASIEQMFSQLMAEDKA